MSWKLANILAASSLVLIFVLFEVGVMGPANAFFFAGTALTAYTAYQFLRRDGMSLKEALQSIFLRPATGGGRMRTYITYMGCTVLGVFVAVQAIATGI